MKVSVIVPVFNREVFIQTALRSLLRHDINMDILVVNDGSTDKTLEIVQSLQATNPSIRIINQPNQGVAAARNVGLQNLLPDTDFISFLDSDDVSVAERYTHDLKLFASDPSLEMVYSQLMLVDAIDNEALQPKPEALKTIMHGVSLTTTTFRRSLIKKIGLLDPQYKQAEDLDYMLRIFEYGTRYVLADHIAVLYRRHQGNMTNDKTETRREIMKAILRSVQRRKKNPHLCGIPRFIDIVGMTKNPTPTLNKELHPNV